jgi:hypothetical protein
MPTIFKLARERGYTTALFAGKEKFRHLNVPAHWMSFRFQLQRQSRCGSGGKVYHRKEAELVLHPLRR